ncbi:hypothetical protein BVRB_1g011190 [Beta vulgaris subsp. vulgaris]|nr:hypothetical protein BVRB_1g011190 [Beta vulgaris subsp. vulgaris]
MNNENDDPRVSKQDGHVKKRGGSKRHAYHTVIKEPVVLL